MKKMPKTREEWIAYSNRIEAAKKRTIPVVEIPLENVEQMWNYQYQAKYYTHSPEGSPTLSKILASNSLNKLKQEVKKRKFKLVYLSTTQGIFSSGQRTVGELPYKPQY